MKEGLIILGFFAGAAALVFGIAAILTFTIKPRQCHAAWDSSGYEARWSFWGGCQINVDGKWMPTYVFRNIDVQGVTK